MSAPRLNNAADEETVDETEAEKHRPTKEIERARCSELEVM